MRWFVLLYGSFRYILFILTLFYSVAFIGNLQWFFPQISNLVPLSIDAAQASSSPYLALIIDSFLLFLFGLQHSGMARFGFKDLFNKHFPPILERMTYVLFSSLALILLIVEWRTLPFVIWDVRETWLGDLLLFGFFAGWTLVVIGASLIGKHDPFGIKRTIYHFQGKEFVHTGFAMPFWYKYVRHPIYLAFFMAFWLTPYMSAGHLLFALMVSFYLWMAIALEERDLVQMYGDTYKNYQAKVNKFLPPVWRLFCKKK